MDKKTFNLWNRIVALAVFVIASVTYLSTIEPHRLLLGLR